GEGRGRWVWCGCLNWGGQGIGCHKVDQHNSIAGTAVNGAGTMRHQNPPPRRRPPNDSQYAVMAAVAAAAPNTSSTRRGNQVGSPSDANAAAAARRYQEVNPPPLRPTIVSTKSIGKTMRPATIVSRG